MEDIVIPHYFLCPISLEIMRDPVTVVTGITYDRDSIEQWIFTSKNKTCPITRKPLPDTDITPNHTLRRLIQAWCIVNAANGVERIPTPKPPVDKTQIVKLLEEARKPHSQIKSLHKLKAIAAESDRNKRCIEAAGAVSSLASILKDTSEEPVLLDDGVETTRACDEALSILYNLQISEEGVRELASKNGDCVASLVQIMQRGKDESRAYATFLLRSICKVLDPIHMFGLRCEVFRETVNVLRDQISHQATKAALGILMEACPWGRNRIKAAEAGAVRVLIELLLETYDRRRCEMMLAVLDQICKCAEGRANLLGHPAGLAVVSKKIIRVSLAASDRAVRILYSIATFSANPNVVQEMLQVGVVSKLCLVLQVDFSMKAREMAKEILSRHSKAWRNSSCIPVHLMSSFPSGR